MSVYEYKIDKDIEYIKTESTLNLPIKRVTRDKIIDIFSSYKKIKYFNGKVVRLEKIENHSNKIKLTISLIDFYDFFIVNIISAQLEAFVQYLKIEDIYDKLSDEMECLRQYHSVMLQAGDFTSLIKQGISSNALAMSVLITDENGDYLLTQRGTKTGISEMMHSVTATGAIEEDDFYCTDVIRNCVIRELKEELNLFIEKKELKISSIVAGTKKRQPIVIVNGSIKGRFSEMKELLMNAKDYNYEVHKLIIANKEGLKKIFHTGNFTEAIEYHLQSAIM